MTCTPELYLNPFTENDRYQSYESCTEATGREYLFREVCGAAALPPGEGGTDNSRTCRYNRNPSEITLRLGVRKTDIPPRRTARFIGSPRRKTTHSFARKIIFTNFVNPLLRLSQILLNYPSSTSTSISNTQIPRFLRTFVALAHSSTGHQRRSGFFVPYGQTETEHPVSVIGFLPRGLYKKGGAA